MFKLIKFCKVVIVLLFLGLFVSGYFGREEVYRSDYLFCSRVVMQAEISDVVDVGPAD